MQRKLTVIFSADVVGYSSLMLALLVVAILFWQFLLWRRFQAPQ